MGLREREHSLLTEVLEWVLQVLLGMAREEQEEGNFFLFK